MSHPPRFHFQFKHKDRFEATPLYKKLSSLPDGMAVYKLTERNLNKVYVGSSVSVRQRCMGYFYPNSSDYAKTLFWDVNPRFIEIEILELVYDYETLRDREHFWIAKLNTFFPFGLNVNKPADKTIGCYRAQYRDHLREIKSKGACWHFLNHLNRVLYFAEAANREFHDNTPLLNVGQHIMVGNATKMTCKKIVPVMPYAIGGAIDNKYMMESKTGNKKSYLNNDIKLLLIKFNN